MWEGDEQDLTITRELKFAAVELGQSPVLGRDVRLELTPGTTVLVGRNGAGKSAILERIVAGLQHVTLGIGSADPSVLACDLQAGARLIRYRCIWSAPVSGGEAETREPLSSVAQESCAAIEPAADGLWSAVDGRVIRADGGGEEVPPGLTYLQWATAGRRSGTIPAMVYPLRNLFSSVSHITPGALRGDGDRRELIVPDAMSRWMRSPEWASRRQLGWLLHTVKRWHEKESDMLAELIELGRRTGLCRDIQVKIYRDPDRSSKNDLISASVDGVDLGLLSDGTIRGLQLLRALIEPQTKLILIDEPESAVHPGLLGKLLHEIEAYCADRQVVLSTHSPQVVSWARPDAIRLVERREGVTQVRGLGERAIKYLEKYLHDEDNLGEFVFGGGLDDFSE